MTQSAVRGMGEVDSGGAGVLCWLLEAAGVAFMLSRIKIKEGVAIPHFNYVDPPLQSVYCVNTW